MTGARVGICADDFGMSVAVDAAIIDLAGRGRLSAVSCLVDTANFASHAGALVAFRQQGQLDIGLHLNLTENFDGAWPRWPLPALVARAYGGRLDAALLAGEIRRQLDRFEEVLGFLPDHVDGHQHVQQLPGVRSALVEELARRGGARPWIRTSLPAPRPRGSGAGARLRNAAIGAFGAGRMHGLLAARGFGSNRRLLGQYSDRCDMELYFRWLREWMAGARDGDLLMCHPAAPERGAAAQGRSAEYRVLSSTLLPGVLATHGIAIVRLSQEFAGVTAAHA